MSGFSRRTVGPIVLLVVGALLAYFLVPRFGTRINIGYFLLQSVPLLLTAVGQTLVIMTAGIDLSVGACVTLAGVIASLVMDPANGGSVPLALAACVGAAVAVGLVNGLLIVRYNLPLPKLDMIAGPGSSQFFGAMENWGAIFYFERDLEIDPKLSTEAEDRKSVV